MKEKEDREFKTQLEYRRWMRHETQESMSRKTGIGLRTYRRLENGEIGNPPIGYLVNIAIVLDLTLSEICETDWLSWREFNADARAPGGRVKLDGRPWLGDVSTSR